MLYCEQCREKNNWPDGLVENGKCSQCSNTCDCYDVPAVMLVPEPERSLEQKEIYKIVQQGFKDKSEQMVIAYLDGRVNVPMTTKLRELFILRKQEVDWYATYQIRRKAQEGYLESERTKRDRRQNDYKQGF